MASQSSVAQTAKPASQTATAQTRTGTRRRIRWGPIILNLVLVLICVVWTIPTLGLLVSSFRTREDILSSGWWNVVPHPEWVSARTIQLPDRVPLDQPLQIEGATVTDQQLRDGFTLPDGQRLTWANRRARLVDVQAQQLVADTDLTLDSYRRVITGKTIAPDGTERLEPGADLGTAFLNSLVVTIPATGIPILIAAFAAYAFAWMRFRGRKFMFGVVVALLVVPLQIALSPILRDYQNLNLTGTYLAVWLAHTGFGLALAIYLLYNYISQLPRDLFESAFIDGASPFTVFTRLVLPLSVPALASFAIFQFLWVWNDYLVALIFLGGQTEVMTMRLVNLIGSRGQDWHLLTAGAFLSMLLPLLVFFSLQRFFVRGLLAGSVKG